MIEFQKKITGGLVAIDKALDERGFGGFWTLTRSVYSTGFTIFPEGQEPISLSLDELAEWIYSQPTIEEKKLCLLNHRDNVQKQIEAMEW